MLKEQMKGWIVLANATDARVFNHNGRSMQLEAVRNFHSDETRLHAADMVTDRQGRVFESAVPGRHAVEPRTDLHRQAKTKFAHEISEFLNHAAIRGHFTGLILVAPPQFLGELRAQLNDQARKKITLEIDKDMHHLSADEIPHILMESAVL